MWESLGTVGSSPFRSSGAAWEPAAKFGKDRTVSKYAATPTSRECTFGEDEIIVSKTDNTGRITYANDVFLKVALYQEHEILGQPHSILRHPDMPRCVFKLLWDTIQDGREIFAYVKNMTKNGDFYWVFAHVTPSFAGGDQIVGFHSNRRSPRREALEKIEPIYRLLLDEENRHANRKEGMMAGYQLLSRKLEELGMDYDEFVFSL